MFFLLTLATWLWLCDGITSTMVTKSYRLMMVHTPNSIAYNVKSLSNSVKFYENVIGMSIYANNEKNYELHYTKDNSNKLKVLLQSSDNSNSNNKSKSNEIGFKGIGLKLNKEDIVKAISLADKYGGRVEVNLGDYAYGASLIPDEDDLKQFPVKYTHLMDPDGNGIEIIEEPEIPTMTSLNYKLDELNVFNKVIFNVIDIEETVMFYEMIFNMILIRKRSNVNGIPKDASISAFLVNNKDSYNTMIELFYKYSIDKLDIKNTYQHMVMTTDNIINIKEKIEIYNNVHSKKSGYNCIDILSESENSLIITDPINGYKIKINKE